MSKPHKFSNAYTENPHIENKTIFYYLIVFKRSEILPFKLTIY